MHNQTYPTPALNATQYPGNSSTWEIGPFNFTNAAAPHTITVCADIDGDVDEYKPGGEDNNCTENVFGAPDLEISYFLWDEDGVVDPYGDADGKVDNSSKTYYLVYRVRNVGDANVTVPFWMNLSRLNTTTAEPECTIVDGPVRRLNVSEETPNRVVGPFRIGEDNVDWVQVCADYNDTITENYEHVPGEIQPQWERCMPEYSGCCDKCGDVNCMGGVNMVDYDDLFDYVGGGSSLSCKWAGDVNCMGGVNMVDYDNLFDYLGGGPLLDCCEGGCPT